MEREPLDLAGAVRPACSLFCFEVGCVAQPHAQKESDTEKGDDLFEKMDWMEAEKWCTVCVWQAHQKKGASFRYVMPGQFLKSRTVTRARSECRSEAIELLV